jgi:hypothetical protein
MPRSRHGYVEIIRQEIEALLRLLAEMERSGCIRLLMLERREAEREGGCANNQTPAMWRGSICL